MSNSKTSVMKQIGVDIVQLPEVNGKKYLIVAIDYISKWSEMEAIENKTEDVVVRFLFKLICKHSCMSVQINGERRDFIDRVSSHLHELTGTKQCVTSAYMSQSNVIVERQNRTIKNMFLKTLRNEKYVDKWPDVIDSMLFIYSVQQNSKKSTATIRVEDLVLLHDMEWWDKTPHAMFFNVLHNKYLYSEVNEKERQIHQYLDKLNIVILKEDVIHYKCLDLEDNSSIKREANTEMVKCTPASSASGTFCFRPINIEWQREQSKRLGFNYVYNENFNTSENSVLHPPLECYDVVGDGNCFFRCIALCVTGTEVNHRDIRRLIVDYMQINNEKVEKFAGINNYLQNSGMEQFGVWATDIEISFTAAFIDTDIYTFTQKSNGISNWVRHPSSLRLKGGPNYDKMALYLNHKHSNHYQVVIKVKK